MAEISVREGQVLAMAAQGMTDDRIAKELEISVATVRGYWLRVRTKLGGSSRAELVGQWVRLNSIAENARTAEEHDYQTRNNREEFQKLLEGERTATDEVFSKATPGQRSLVREIRRESDEAMKDAHDGRPNRASRLRKKGNEA